MILLILLQFYLIKRDKCYVYKYHFEIGSSWEEFNVKWERRHPCNAVHWVLSTFFLFSWWRHQMETFSALLAICVGNSPVPVNSPHKSQWHGALMFSLICAWINVWVNTGEAGDLKCHHAHYDVIVMWSSCCCKVIGIIWPLIFFIYLKPCQF